MKLRELFNKPLPKDRFSYNGQTYLLLDAKSNSDILYLFNESQGYVEAELKADSLSFQSVFGSEEEIINVASIKLVNKDTTIIIVQDVGEIKAFISRGKTFFNRLSRETIPASEVELSSGNIMISKKDLKTLLSVYWSENLDVIKL